MMISLSRSNFEKKKLLIKKRHQKKYTKKKPKKIWKNKNLKKKWQTIVKKKKEWNVLFDDTFVTIKSVEKKILVIKERHTGKKT